MKRLLLVVLLIFVVFVALNRQRLFLRDPLARITRDGVKVTGAVAMINYSNDVLLRDSSGGKPRVYLVQSWNHALATPAAPLVCLAQFACRTDADQASASPVVPGSRGKRPAFEGVTMTDRRVEFVDEDGALVQVVLR